MTVVFGAPPQLPRRVALERGEWLQGRRRAVVADVAREPAGHHPARRAAAARDVGNRPGREIEEVLVLLL